MNDSIPHIELNENDLHEVIRLRRHFHKHPETGFTEFWTTSEICSYLSALGFQVNYGKALYEEAYPDTQHISELVKISRETIDTAFQAARSADPKNKWLPAMEGGFTGAIATLECDQEGPVIGFRVDIDALPITESSGSNHSPFACGFSSTNQNMHACGHDGHTSIGLALAKKIAENKTSLRGKFILVFQASEEGPSGGEVFSRFNFFKQMDRFLSLHLGLIDERKVICGLNFLSVKSLKITYRGNSSHAAVSPDSGNNALQAACMAITNLYGIPRHGEGVCRINVGQLHSDNPTNVISDCTHFEVEFRGENKKIDEYMLKRTTDILKGAALANGVEVEIEDNGYYVSAENSRANVAVVKQAVLNAGIPENAVINECSMPASEDATFLINEVNQNGGLASYLCLGSQTFGGHHNPDFDFDEDMLIHGVNILWEYIGCVYSQS